MITGATVKNNLKDNLKTFRAYEILTAGVCIIIPLILRVYDKDQVYPIKVKFVSSGILADSASSLIPRQIGNVRFDSLQRIVKDPLGFRTSISDYAYSTNSYLFGMLLCVAAMLFIFNGAVYFRREGSLNLNDNGKWYNVILGFSLLGVICCPYRDWQTLHYIFAALFFFGNAVVIGIYHNKQDKKKSIVMALLTAGFLITTVIWKQHLNLFWGEWASLTVIGIHFILQARSVKRR